MKSLENAKKAFELVAEDVKELWKPLPPFAKALLAAVGTMIAIVIAVVMLGFFLVALVSYPAIIIPTIIVSVLWWYFYDHFKRNG